MHKLLLTVAFLVAHVSHGRRVQNLKSREAHESQQLRQVGAEAASPLEVLETFLLARRPRSAFHHSGSGFRSFIGSQSAVLDHQNRIAPSVPAMAEANWSDIAEIAKEAAAENAKIVVAEEAKAEENQKLLDEKRSEEGQSLDGAAAEKVADGSPRDLLVTALSEDGTISAKAIDTTAIADEVAQLQGLSGLAVAALGRAITCCLLIAEGQEPAEVFQVKFDGDGPINGVLASANGALEARGLVGNPTVYLPANALGKFDVGGAVGQGRLYVTRTKNLPGATQATPYQSITDIQTGEVPEDINYYLSDSEQKTGALAAGVLVKGLKTGLDLNNKTTESANVLAMGGWYVNCLPGATEESLQALQKNLEAQAGFTPTKMLMAGLGPEDIVKLLLDGMNPTIMGKYEPKSIVKSCKCSEERLLRSLSMLPEEEIEDIYLKDETLECHCDFCGKRFTVAPDEIRCYLAQEITEKREYY